MLVSVVQSVHVQEVHRPLFNKNVDYSYHCFDYWNRSWYIYKWNVRYIFAKKGRE